MIELKRIICILSLLAMIVFLCACGGLNTNNDEESQDTDHLAEQFEEVNLISVNEDEAQENGGLYILFKNQYYPLQCGGWAVNSYRAVSYTHLDVYKRQESNYSTLVQRVCLPGRRRRPYRLC